MSDTNNYTGTGPNYRPVPRRLEFVYLEVKESFDFDNSKYLTLLTRVEDTGYVKFLWRSPEVNTLLFDAGIKPLRGILQDALDHYGFSFDLTSDNIYDWQGIYEVPPEDRIQGKGLLWKGDKR